MSIGAALTKEALFNERTSRTVNTTLAEYHVPVQADVLHIDILCNSIPDEHIALGTHGVGEISITSCAAICKATGVLVRSLPITLAKVLAWQGHVGLSCFSLL